MKKQSILVTGCAGFIGSRFVATFKKKYPTQQIIGIDNFATGKKEVLDRSITFYEGSITDSALVERIFKKHAPTYVFHFAALPRVSYSVEHPIKSAEVNVLGTIILLDAAARHGTKRFIYSASSSAYGGAKKLPTKETENPPQPTSPYAAQKYTGEVFCKVWSDLFGLDTISLRYFNVYGPGQYGDAPYSTVISAWLEALYFPSHTRPFLEGNGSVTRDFTYIDNVIDANLLAMRAKQPLQGVVVNIGHGERHSVQTVRRLIEHHTGKKLDLEKRPPRKGDVKHTHADIARAKKILGYAPTISFEEGLGRTVAWFEERAEREKRER